MHHRHVDPRKFAGYCYEYGNLSGMRAWKTHLSQLSGCPGCVEALLKFYQFESFAEMAALKEPGRELSRRLQRMDTDPLLKMLAPLSELGRINRVNNDHRFHSVAVAKALLRQTRSRWGSEPLAAFQDAHLALAAIHEIQPQDPELPCGGKRQFEALAWAHQGNALRILCDLHNAEVCFAVALRRLNAKHGDPLIRATVLKLKSSLLRAQRSFKWAMAAIDEAIEIFQQEEEILCQADALLVSAKLRADANNPEEALEALEQASALDQTPKRGRRASLFASLKLGVLWHLKRYNDAALLLPEAKRLASRSKNSTDAIRLRWSEARISAGLGNSTEAEEIYKEVRAGFLSLNYAYDVALVSLELAQLYAEQERHAEIQQLASEMIPIFQANKIHRETLAAVQLFADAVRDEQEQQEVIGKLSAYLADARHDPSLRFSL